MAWAVRLGGNGEDVTGASAAGWGAVGYVADSER